MANGGRSTQFFADVDALAAVLQRDMGVKRGDRIAIAMRNCPDWILTFAAAVHVGAVPVLINSWGSAEELEFTLRDSDPTVLAADLPRTRLAADALRQRRTAVLFSDVDGGIERLDHDALAQLDLRTIRDAVAAGRGRDYATAKSDPEDMAMLLYTSGSTGHPKGVVYRHVSVGQALMNMMLSGFLPARTRRPHRTARWRDLRGGTGDGTAVSRDRTVQRLPCAVRSRSEGGAPAQMARRDRDADNPGREGHDASRPCRQS